MNKKVVIGAVVLVLALIIGGYFVIYKNHQGFAETPLLTVQQEVSSKEVSAMVLNVDELPNGYSVKDRAPRTKSDVVDSALELGWKEGYLISFVNANDNEYSITTVYQHISRYPLENISTAISLLEAEEGISIDLIQTDKIGEESYAYKVTDETDFVGSYGYYEVIFRKKDILVTMQMFGTAQDFELLVNLAKKAVQKI